MKFVGPGVDVLGTSGVGEGEEAEARCRGARLRELGEPASRRWRFAVWREVHSRGFIGARAWARLFSCARDLDRWKDAAGRATCRPSWFCGVIKLFMQGVFARVRRACCGFRCGLTCRALARKVFSLSGALRSCRGPRMEKVALRELALPYCQRD